MLTMFRKPEPLGWDFEDVKFRRDPIPDTWWFVPWKNTERRGPDEAPPFPVTYGKLPYFDVNPLQEEYRGSGLIIDEVGSRVVGCYKVRADTEDGYDTKQELFEAKHKRWHEGKRPAPTKLSRTRKPQIRDTLVESDSNATSSSDDGTHDGTPLDLPNEIRKLNGLILDPRPVRIALHPKDREAFHIPVDITELAMERYGAKYMQLEHTIRNAMRDTLDKKQQLPAFRSKQIEDAEKAGHPEPDFTDE